MMEYFYFDVIAILFLLLVDYFLRTGVVRWSKSSVSFWVVVIVMFYIFESIAIDRWWRIPFETTSGIFLGFGVPLEELLFTIFWVLLVLVPWEYLKKNVRL